MSLAIKSFASPILLLAIAGPAMAQSSVVFRNASPAVTVPLDGSQPVTFNAEDNNIEASCLLQPAPNNGLCQGIGQQVNAQAPVVTLSIPDKTPDGQGRYVVESGEQFSIRRVVTNSPHVCLATASVTTGVVGWENAVGPAADTSVSVRLSSQGDVTLRYRCYNVGGAQPTAAELNFVVNAPVGPNPDSCTVTSPQINPAGFTRYTLSWNDLYGTGAFPGFTVRSPVGSYTIGRSFGGPVSAGMFITVPVTVDTSRTYTMRHYPAQYVMGSPPGVPPQTWYPGDPSRAGSTFVSISPCAGDLRAWSPISSDPWLNRCRTDQPLKEGPFAFTTKANAGALCQLQAGQTYWLTYAMVNPNDGLTTTEHLCDSGERCETTVEVRVD